MRIKSKKCIIFLVIIIIVNCMIIVTNIIVLMQYDEKYRHKYQKEIINAYNIGFDDANKIIK
ncbi:MAG: hypothetical protein IMY72_11880 [Bacteroidetes bacterium]|nr:hypothetical protein [Bacteroidota bacterium]